MKVNLMKVKIDRIAKICWVAIWLYVWATAFDHYYSVGKAYADAEVFNTNPVIYAAVESWFLMTVIILMWLSWKLIEVVTDAS